MMEDAKQFVNILRNIDTVCKNMGIEKQVQVLSCDKDEYDSDYIDYRLTGDEKIDAPILKYCNQNGIKLMVNSNGSEYLNELVRKHRIIIVKETVPEYEPSLGLQFTYHQAPGADEEELTFSWYGEDALSDEEYKEAYEDAKQWVDKHPGAYITSGEDVIYRGKIVEIFGQLNLLEGVENVF